MSIFTWSSCVFFTVTGSATNSGLFETNEIKCQYREAKGTRPRWGYRKYYACNLAKIHSHVCTGGKGTVVILKAFWMLVCTEGLAYAIHQPFFMLYQVHFSLLWSSALSLSRTRAPMGIVRLWAALLSQSRGVLHEWYLLKQSMCRCPTLKTIQPEAGMDPLWFRAHTARWCWGGDILQRAFGHSTCFLVV